LTYLWNGRYKETISFLNQEARLAMKKAAFISSLVFFIVLFLYPPLSTSQEASKLASKYGGRIFKSPSDPDYLSYEREIKALVLQEIRKQHGVELNAEGLSPNQLLEIEALLRLKRSSEPVENILRRFPGVLLKGPST
jgi:hypothetical protein